MRRPIGPHNDHGRLVNRGDGLPVRRNAKQRHFVFLIDTSGSMREGGVARQFAQIHGELLDEIADQHPGSLVSCLTFNEKAYSQYVAQPIESAPSLSMEAKWGTEMPLAICTELAFTIDPRLVNEDITVVIVTDGDTDEHGGKYSEDDAAKCIDRWRGLGVKFLFLSATYGDKDTPESIMGQLMFARMAAKLIGIRPEEVMLWGHTAKGLSETFGKVSETLSLGSAKRRPRLPDPQPYEALPPYRPSHR